MAPGKAIDPRQERGLALAKAKRGHIRHIAGGRYFVPSANGSTSYVVDVEERHCTCPDHEERMIRCKHMWAVEHFREERDLADGTTVVTEAVRLTYGQNWSAYNRAQTTEKDHLQVLLRELCNGITEPEPKRMGRPRLPLADVIFAATLKVYTTMSGRRATPDIRASADDEHVAPSYNSLFRAMDRADLAPLLKSLVEQSARPLAAVEKTFAADGTGFSTTSYERWFDHRYGEERKYRRFVKAHAMCGTLTNVVTAVEVTESSVADVVMLEQLLGTTAKNGFKMDEVSADKAYLSHANLAAIERVGAVPFIPFKENSVSTGSPAWERMWHYASFRRDEFLAHYHRRSNVEATFSAIKRKFGPGVRSKLPAAQVNEVLLKCLCQNLSCLVQAFNQLGIEPTFWQRK